MLLAIADKIILCLTMRGTDGSSTKNADRFCFQITMPTFHKNGDRGLICSMCHSLFLAFLLVNEDMRGTSAVPSG